MQLLCRIHLDCGKAEVAPLLRLTGHVARPVPANPGIDLDSISRGTTQQLVDGHAKGLALDVPQSHLKTGDNGPVDGAATEEGPVQLLPEALDFERVPPNDALRQLVRPGHNGFRLGAGDHLSPAVDPLVSLHARKDPSRLYLIHSYAGNDHS